MRSQMKNMMKTLCVLITLFIFSGCLAAQNHPSMEALEKAKGISPLVEGYIEYGGPNQVWAGPESFILHVNAKDAGLAKIEVLGGPNQPDDAAERRGLASDHTMSADAAREELKTLAMALEQEEAPAFYGCLSPLRVRLISMSGAVQEKQGCRSQKGWPASVSQFTNRMLASATK